MSNTLEIRGLKTHFFTRSGVVPAVNGVDLTVAPGQVLGIVGESGSGKSVTGFSILRLIDPPGKIIDGTIRFKGTDILTLPEEKMRQLRGSRISMIFQDPMMTLNPVLRIETQMVETVLAHEKVSKEEARQRSRDALGAVGISSPDERLAAYPHHFSGGMRQRVAIAIAMLHNPDLIVADEPTTALDVTIQAQILAEIQKLIERQGTSLIWITHDLSVVAGLADRLAVMYAGRVVEEGTTEEVLSRSLHPYTLGLIDSLPESGGKTGKLRHIKGLPPNMLLLPEGCAFQPRCSHAQDDCSLRQPEPIETSERNLVRCFHPVTEKRNVQ